MKPYLTPQRAAEVVAAVRSLIPRNIKLLVGVSDEEVEQLLAMALDAPRVRGRQARATWSAFEAGAKYGAELEAALGRMYPRTTRRQIEEIGCAFDRHHCWRLKFNETDPEGDR